MGGGRGSGRYPERRQFRDDIPVGSWIWCLLICALIGGGIGMLDAAKKVVTQRRGEGVGKVGVLGCEAVAGDGPTGYCKDGKCPDGCCRKGGRDCCCGDRVGHCKCEPLPDPSIEDERDG